jgi:LCP family protein required for cell wall assembly
MVGLAIAFLIATIVTAYLTFVTVRAIATSRGITLPSSELLLEEPSAEQALITGIDLDTPLQSSDGPTSIPWDGASRVNILLMGLDYRDWEGEGPSRTDTMILFTIDPTTRSAGMLSIPRDLWVYIPGFEYAKINTAHYLGEAYDTPGGGPGLAIQTVEQFLGIPINFYAQVDFFAFERLIDEIGGLEMNIPEAITVDPIGPGNTVDLEPGVQTIDGATALAYARNRDTFGGDFDRSQRQQQVIMAIRENILSLEMIPVLITKAPILYHELSSGVHSNLTLDEIIKLAWLAQQVSGENINRAAIGTDQVNMTMSPDGQDILQPDPDKIRMLRDEVFTSTGPITPIETNEDPKELMLAESAMISVLNATITPGLAAETTEYLISEEINVVNTSNAQDISASTVIIDYSGKPYTVQYIVQLMNIQPSNIYSRYDPNSEVDITILLGDDWVTENPLP